MESELTIDELNNSAIGTKVKNGNLTAKRISSEKWEVEMNTGYKCTVSHSRMVPAKSARTLTGKIVSFGNNSGFVAA